LSDVAAWSTRWRSLTTSDTSNCGPNDVELTFSVEDGMI